MDNAAPVLTRAPKPLVDDLVLAMDEDDDQDVDAMFVKSPLGDA